MFALPEVSDRLHNENLDLEERLIRDDFALKARAKEILGDKLPEGMFGIGNGPYSAQHKRLRTNWHQALSKLHGKDRLKEAIIINANLIVSQIHLEMREHKDGFEPLNVLMNGAMNVVTSFALGTQYGFDDPNFIKIRKMIKVIN